MELLNFDTGMLHEDDFIPGRPIGACDFLLFVNSANGVEVRGSQFLSEEIVTELADKARKSKYCKSSETASYLFFWYSEEWLGPGCGEGFQEPTGALSAPMITWVPMIDP